MVQRGPLLSLTLELSLIIVEVKLNKKESANVSGNICFIILLIIATYYKGEVHSQSNNIPVRISVLRLSRIRVDDNIPFSKEKMLIKKVKGLPAGIDPDGLPKHIAIIMDGNGRWAKKRKLPRIEGHRAGSRAVRETVETCVKAGISVLTLYAFSTENWNRPKDEVDALMDLLSQYLDREAKTVLDNRLKFKMIGRREGLRKDIITKVDKMERDSANGSGMIFCLALNYSGRAELVDCIKNIAAKSKNNHNIEINEKTVTENLYTFNIPDPDLLIRTSGEMRISNFLLWQIAYSEIWITDVLWPDFKAKHLFQAIRDYQKRERRFGGIKE